jgi:hypothetical protein
MSVNSEGYREIFGICEAARRWRELVGILKQLKKLARGLAGVRPIISMPARLTSCRRGGRKQPGNAA